MSHAVFKFDPPIEVERIFLLHRFHPHSKCHVWKVRVEDHDDGERWLYAYTEKGCFAESLDAGVVGIACERPV